MIDQVMLVVVSFNNVLNTDSIGCTGFGCRDVVVSSVGAMACDWSV